MAGDPRGSPADFGSQGFRPAQPGHPRAGDRAAALVQGGHGWWPFCIKQRDHMALPTHRLRRISEQLYGG